jgi:hypothetical protein
MLALPDRLAPRVMGLTDVAEIERILTDEVRIACRELDEALRGEARRLRITGTHSGSSARAVTYSVQIVAAARIATRGRGRCSRSTSGQATQ